MRELFKKLAKSFSLVLFYVLVQCVVITGVMLFYVYFVDGFWTDLVDAIDSGKGSITIESMSVMCRILVPSMLLSDLLTTIPIMMFSKKKNEKLIKKIEINKFFIIILLSLGLNIITEFMLNFVPSDILNNYNELMSVTNDMTFLQQMLIVGILAPIVEELIFRYAFIRPFRNYKPKLIKCDGITIGIILSALSFGIAHGNLVQGIYAFAFGLILGYIYTREFNLAESILMHMTINSSSVVLSTLKEPYSYVMMIMMVISFILGIVLLVKEKEKCRMLRK